jgi:hypothetical protein
MAKISTYTTVTPQLGDMLIGTDVNDMNMTKNFTVGDIISLANLGTYVPYTGATGDVDLGVHGLTSTRLTVSNNAEINQVSAYGNTFYIVDNLVTAPGLQLEFANNKYYLGDVISNVNGTYVLVDDANSRIEFSKAIRTNGSTGTSGQVLTSQGSGSPATWTTPPYVTHTYGSFYDTTTQQTVGGETLPMKLNTTDATSTSGFSITNDTLGRPTRITSTVTGVYNIQFSAQFHQTGGTASQVYIWFRINGADIADSATTITCPSGNLLVAAWNFFTPLTAGQYIEIMWRSNNANIEIQRNTTIPSVPGIPSVIATINRVS